MMQQGHEWFTELIPAYAIGAADEDERAAVDAHLKTCTNCRALLEDYRGLGDGLLFAAPLAPARAGLSENLRKRLNVRPEPVRQGAWWDFLRRPAFVFAVAALALLVFTNVYWAGRVGRLEQQSREIASLPQAAGIRLNAADSKGGGYNSQTANGVVYVQPGSKIALLCVYALPQPGPGKTYQAWLVRDGKRVNAGTFAVNGDGYGVLIINSGQPVSDYQQLGITVEPAGGSPAPTTPRVIGGEL